MLLMLSKKSFNGFETFKMDADGTFDILDSNVVDDEKSFNPPKIVQYLVERKVSFDQINEVRMEFMPGFEIKWSVTPGYNIPCFNDSDVTKEFRKFANLITLSGVERDLVWNIIRKFKTSALIKNIDSMVGFPCYKIHSADTVVSSNFLEDTFKAIKNELEQRFRIWRLTNSIIQVMKQLEKCSSI